MSDASDLFRKMAERIDANADAGFGGAFVIVPPEGGGDPASTMIIDPTSDPTAFWSFLKTKAEISLDAMQREAQRRSKAWG
ncbi:MAG: hypothetical protein KGL39_07680 [Patescibacteria group bacterium]|nr:hypothetical protein [Patescibacteria group bacterium]